ncbi:MAG: hydantoinase/oxoprolinase family protein, partial [Acidimicrobiales bacterium]|nr:hydantoinase/oxoprolinase family protein [Acidimicrobiales bacterium]
ALVTTEGFADVIEIGRQHRPSLYDPWADRPAPLVERRHRHEVRGRLDHVGAELVPLGDPPPLGDDVEAVAVCLLHADVDDRHERAVAAALRARGHDVSASHEVAPEFREYERTVTTVMNAYLRPACARYLRSLAGLAGEVTVMTSAGGLVGIEDAAATPAALLLSGPAGGARAAAAVARANGFPTALSFDMGGTSTDVCLVLSGQPAPAAQRDVAGLPVRLPSLDVHTIGAGGGSIARLDPGGALVVGPASAGADPGPACYGRGGTAPTVTDANLVAGRIPAGAELPGLGRLDRDAAEAALGGLGVGDARAAAEGVLRVVDAAMERALRTVSVARGVDPRDGALVAFGGAGPLHACALADALGVTTVLVPARAGVLSAVGILASPRQHDLVRSWPDPGDLSGVDVALDALAAEAAASLGAGPVTVERLVDCRYAGQSHELSVPDVASFAAEHERRNGYARPGAPVEVVALRATARRPAPLDVADLPAPDRARGAGPVALVEP